MSSQSTDERTCATCGYRRGSFRMGVCQLSGTYPDLTRQYHRDRCDEKFSGWTPRTGLIRRIVRLFGGARG